MSKAKGMVEVPDSENEDEDLQKAIAMSKEQPSSPLPNTRKRKAALKQTETVSLISDDEGDDVQEKLRSSTTGSPANKKARSDSQQPGGISWQERKKMEDERLARIQAMKSVTPSGFYGNEALTGQSRWRAVHTEKKILVDLSHSPEPEPAPLRFAKGMVKRTFRTNFTREADDITIDEVLEKETLELSVLSSFQWDYEWIMDKLPLSRKSHRMVFVMQAKSPEERRLKEGIFEGLPRIELVFPNMEGQVNCMHSKLMLLFHRDQKTGREWLRIAVPTANLTDYDWGMMSGVMENMVFIIDLPKLDVPNPEQTFFLEELLHFCSEQGFPHHVLNDLVHYDFSATKEMAFVHTIGGSHGGKDWERTGFCGLGRAIKKLGYNTGKGLEVDYVTSSLGAAKPDFISCIYRAAQGHTGIKDLQRRNKGTIKSAPPKRGGKNIFGAQVASAADESTDDEDDFEEETNWEAIRRRFRVFFPSAETVRNSRGGEPSGGTICFQRQWWTAPTFPKTLLRDTKSVREGTLMHNKLLFARPAKTLNSRNGQMAAWAYVGSANLSESAWGKLVVDRSTKSPKINCKNWECGVIIPVPASNLGVTVSGRPVEQDGPADMRVFKGVVPVPMQTPGEPMADKQPWFWMEAVG